MNDTQGNRDLNNSAPPEGPGNMDWQILGEFILANETDRESLACEGAAAAIEAVSSLRLPAERLAGLQNAVERAAQNACQHNNQQQGQSIWMRVLAPPSPARGGRGWSYFMIEKMSEGAEPIPVVELYLYPEG